MSIRAAKIWSQLWVNSLQMAVCISEIPMRMFSRFIPIINAGIVQSSCFHEYLCFIHLGSFWLSYPNKPCVSWHSVSTGICGDLPRTEFVCSALQVYSSLQNRFKYLFIPERSLALVFHFVFDHHKGLFLLLIFVGRTCIWIHLLSTMCKLFPSFSSFL